MRQVPRVPGNCERVVTQYPFPAHTALVSRALQTFPSSRIVGEGSYDQLRSRFKGAALETWPKKTPLERGRACLAVLDELLPHTDPWVAQLRQEVAWNLELAGEGPQLEGHSPANGRCSPSMAIPAERYHGTT